MASALLSREQQRAILEKLYLTTDGLGALERFQKDHAAAAGDFGERSLHAFDVMHILRGAGFSEYDIKRAMRRAGLEGEIVDI